MKFKDLISIEFSIALQEFSNTPMKVSVSYGMSILLDKVEEERVKFKQLRNKIIKKYGELDEKGNPKINKDKTGYLIKDQKAFDEEYEELLELDVKLPTIKIDDIKDLSLSPRCIRALKP
ncbi:MAG: hypothetical protein R3321_12890, partial [Nitrososphaeraceae archaeon]|nr:hypothetical protein [Nitrososphaeraceae archaeon]